MSINPFSRTATAKPKAERLPTFLDNAKCRVIRARFAERERLELITKYRAELAEVSAALKEPRMAWLAEKIREVGGTRTYHLLVNQGVRRGDAEDAVDACGRLLGRRGFAKAEIERLEKLK